MLLPPRGATQSTDAPAGGKHLGRCPQWGKHCHRCPRRGLSRFVGQVSVKRGAADPQVLRDVSPSVPVVLHPPRRGDVT
jgi:hypothetical protein